MRITAIINTFQVIINGMSFYIWEIHFPTILHNADSQHTIVQTE